MKKNGVAIKYGDVAPEAKENFEPIASEDRFGTIKQLQRYNLGFVNYANPCELYQTVLDGTATAFPSNRENINLGLWSEQLSDEDGFFGEPIILELQSVGQYSSQGITLTFDVENGIFANDLNIKWSRVVDGEETVLSEMDFEPSSAMFFCRNLVENYNRVVITFRRMNMPKNRLKLRIIDYGYGTYFYGDELRNTKVIQEIDVISSQISINTADFTLDSNGGVEYLFQKKQPLSIYFNGELKATTFVKKSTRKAKFLWEVQSEDYIGIMDGIPFYGDVYSNKDAFELLVEIFETAKVPFKINEELNGVLLSGYIPFTTCREALMQVAFAVQNVVDTSNSDVVNVFALSDEVTQEIPLDRIMQGQSFSDDDVVTGVRVSEHSYKPSSEKIEVFKAENDGVGKDLFVYFSEPLHSLTISNGEIVSHGTNYAMINAFDGCVLTGKKYSHTVVVREKKNPVILASEIEKVVSIDNATLVSSANIDDVLNKCYNWLVDRPFEVNMKIVEGKRESDSTDDGEDKYVYDMPVNVGDLIVAKTGYLGDVSGRVLKQSFNLGGGIIVKDVSVR